MKETSSGKFEQRHDLALIAGMDQCLGRVDSVVRFWMGK